MHTIHTIIVKPTESYFENINEPSTCFATYGKDIGSPPDCREMARVSLYGVRPEKMATSSSRDTSFSVVFTRSNNKQISSFQAIISCALFP